MNKKLAVPFLAVTMSIALILAPVGVAQAIEPATGIAAAGLVITIGNEIKNLAAKDAKAMVVVKSRTDGPDGDDKALAGDDDADDWIWESDLDTSYLDGRAEAAQIKHHFAAGELHYTHISGKGWRPNPGQGVTGANDDDGWVGYAVAYPDSTPPGETAAATVGAFLWNGSVEFGGYKKASGAVAEVTNSPPRGVQTIIGLDFTRDSFAVVPGSPGFMDVSLTPIGMGGFGNQMVQLYHTSVGFDGSDYSLSNVAAAPSLVTSLASPAGLSEALADEIEGEADAAFAGLNGASSGAGSYMTVGAGALDFTTLSFADGLGSSDDDFIALYLQNVALAAGSAASTGYTGPTPFNRQVLLQGDSFDTSSFIGSPEIMEVGGFVTGCDESGADFCLRIVTEPENFLDALNREIDYNPASDFSSYIDSLPVGDVGLNEFSIALNYGTANSYFDVAGNDSSIGGIVPEPMTGTLLSVGLVGLVFLRRRGRR